jgi:hypothetical protein
MFDRTVENRARYNTLPHQRRVLQGLVKKKAVTIGCPRGGAPVYRQKIKKIAKDERRKRLRRMNQKPIERGKGSVE